MQELDTKKSIVLPPEERINTRLNHILKRTALGAAIVLFLLSLLQVIGYAGNIHWIKHPTDEPPMPSGVAVTFLITSLALLLQCAGKPRRWRLMLSAVLAGIVICAGVSTFIEHTFNYDWGLNYPLWQPPGDAHPLSFPGPMLPDSALDFVLLAAAILLSSLRWTKKYYPYQIAAIAAGVPNIIILCCFSLGMEHICAFFGCFKFCPISSLAFVIAAYAVLFMQPKNGLTNVFVRDTMAGVIIRCIALALLSLTPLLPLRLWLIKFGLSSGLLDAPIANGIVLIIAGISTAGYGAWCLRRIEKVETEKTQIEAEKLEVVEQLKHSIATNAGQPTTFKLVCLECAKEFDDDSMAECPDDGTELIRIADKLRPGSIFADRYKIVRLLGAGGISTVYQADHLHLSKTMALKMLHTHLASDTKTIQRFQREARAASQLSHPNVLEVHDFGVSPDGQAYLVMDFLEGRSLDQHLEERDSLPWQEAVPLILQICDGLNHAHMRGVIHRDLKPANIMLVPKGESDFVAKIVDFGLAKLVDVNAQKLTHTGEVFGSPLCMSPEQCSGGQADERSDIYSIGCIMYDCLAGNPPFVGDSIMETLNMQLSEPPPAMPEELDVPNWLEEIVIKALEKDPAMRQQSVAEVSASLWKGYNAALADATT
ncbi:hypothetical protein BH10CYA1_BH10CYA1_04010 [soil metagenome]